MESMVLDDPESDVVFVYSSDEAKKVSRRQPATPEVITLDGEKEGTSNQNVNLDYNNRVDLISTLRHEGEVKRLRLARENMSLKYPLPPEMWLAWLTDEMELAESPQDQASIMNLFERAIKDCSTVEIWLEYLQYNIKLIDYNDVIKASKNIRQLFERAVRSVGLHITKGPNVWEAFRQFETILISIASDEEERLQQIYRVGNLFQRQLACPHLDMDKTLDEYNVWHTNEGKDYFTLETAIIGNYIRALAELYSILVFEEKIVFAKSKVELLESYQNYLSFEKKNNDPKRIKILYERALIDLNVEQQLWNEYISYTQSISQLEYDLLPIYERATRSVPWCSKIWQHYMRSMESWGKPLHDMQKVLENAVNPEYFTADESRDIWLIFLEYLRRKLDTSRGLEKEKQLKIIRRAFRGACKHLYNYYQDQGDPECVILRFWARTEAIQTYVMETSRIIWMDILARGHAESCAKWLEYISLERHYGDVRRVRELFQRATKAVKDSPEDIINAWIEYERDFGTLEEMKICRAAVRDRADKMPLKRKKNRRKTEYQNGIAGLAVLENNRLDVSSDENETAMEPEAATDIVHKPLDSLLRHSKQPRFNWRTIRHNVSQNKNDIVTNPQSASFMLPDSKINGTGEKIINYTNISNNQQENVNRQSDRPQINLQNGSIVAQPGCSNAGVAVKQQERIDGASSQIYPTLLDYIKQRIHSQQQCGQQARQMDNEIAEAVPMHVDDNSINQQHEDKD